MTEILLTIFLLTAAIYLFIRISRKLRKGGGSLTTTMLGATDLFYDNEKKNAIRQIVEMKVEKKQEKQSSEESEDQWKDSVYYTNLKGHTGKSEFITNRAHDLEVF